MTMKATLTLLGLTLVVGCTERNPLNLDDGSSGGFDAGGSDGLSLDDSDWHKEDALPLLDSGINKSCTKSGQCGPGQFCKFALGCGEDGPGTCADRPKLCPEYYSPVCGCDGKTYGNPCEAESVGVSVDHSGECNAPKTCDQLNQDYVMAVQAAKLCSPMLPVVQCQVEVDNALSCPCPTFVEQANTAALNKLKQIRQQFDAMGCIPYQCGMPCPATDPGQCMPNGSCK
jgi:hypothetical protein